MQAATIESGHFRAAHSTVQTLPLSMAAVTELLALKSGTNSQIPTDYTIVSGTAASGKALFTGTPGVPTAQVTLNAAPTSGTLFFFRGVRQGKAGSAQ